MTAQQATVCPTCQFATPTDQDDHNCVAYLQEVNRHLLADQTKLSDTEPDSDSPDRVSDFRDALRYIFEAKNTEGDCYEFVARLKAKADTALRKWGAII